MAMGAMGTNFKFHSCNTQNALPWPVRREVVTYCALGCVQRCDLRPWRIDQKRKETFMKVYLHMRQVSHSPTCT